jgi:hypothetical protein
MVVSCANDWEIGGWVTVGRLLIPTQNAEM